MIEATSVSAGDIRFQSSWGYQRSPHGDVQVHFGGSVWAPSTDSPDKLISASHSKLVGVGWVHVDGVQTHFLLLFLCHNQFPLRDEEK